MRTMRGFLPVLIVLLFFCSPLHAGSKKESGFGAVGKQCATPDKAKEKTPSAFNRAACSKVEKGKTNCRVSPGSIAHDNSHQSVKEIL